MFGREANAKHMILAENSTKYLGDDQGILNAQLMLKLFQVVAYNLAKSRAARDGNKCERKNFRPKHIKVNHPVVVKDHTAKAFEPRSTDHLCVGFKGKNRVFVKDNHGKVTMVNRKDVSPCEMDVKIAELFNDSRNNSKTRDAQQLMPARQIPDLGWKFQEDVQLVEPVLVQVYSLTEETATPEIDRPVRTQITNAKKSQKTKKTATAENDRPARSQIPDVERSPKAKKTATTENDRPVRPEAEMPPKAKETEISPVEQLEHVIQLGPTTKEEAITEIDRPVLPQTIASECLTFQILETLIFLLISLATIAVIL